jgi:type I restriction enzyme S subunit
LQRGHDLPEQHRRPGKIPILGSFGITGWHDEAKIIGAGVTVGRSGASFGVVSFSPVDFWPLNTALYVIDFHGNDRRFAYYFLKHIDFKPHNSGSAQPSLNRNFLHPLPVIVPPLPEQRAIASILGALDDKIELNFRMNETLEELARTLFKSWFVDFDPVKAKAEGRQPVGMDAETAALFPSRFVESELGRIPEGWKIRPLAECASFVKGVSYMGDALVEESDTALVNLKTFRRGGGFRRDGLKPYSGPFKSDHIVRPGEIVVAQTDVTQAADIIGRAVRVPTGLTFARLVASLDVVIVRPREPLSSISLLGLMQQQRFVDHALAHTNGTTVLHLAREALPTFLAVLPNTQTVSDAHDANASGLLSKAEACLVENDTLAKLRDLLLPKLMSGELRVPDAEKLAEGVP